MRPIWGNEAPVPEEQSKNPHASEIFIREPSILEVTYNRIYFYSAINRSNILKLNQTLRTKSNELLADDQIREVERRTPIFLHISSYGGSIFDGLAALDEISRSKTDVYTTIDGCCASAATFLSLVGKKRFINKHAFMLIHQLSSVMWGKYEEFKDEMMNLDRIMNTIKDIYGQYTKIPMSQINKILKHDLWFDATTCLKYGMVDEILQ